MYALMISICYLIFLSNASGSVTYARARIYLWSLLESVVTLDDVAYSCSVQLLSDNRPPDDSEFINSAAIICVTWYGNSPFRAVDGKDKKNKKKGLF